MAFGYCVACVCVCVCQSWVCLRDILSSVQGWITNLDQICKRTWLRSLLFFGFIDCDLQGQIQLKVKIYPILSLWACPCDKSPPIEVRISKFLPKMHLTIVGVPIDFETYWPSIWVSYLISNLYFQPNFESIIHLRNFVLFSEIMASEPHRWLSSHPIMLGSMWGVLKPSVAARACGSCTRVTLKPSPVVGMPRTDGQILLKISIAINYR